MGTYRKFTDEEFLALYYLGIGDLKIAKKLNVAQNAVWNRRTKLGLIANNYRTCGKGNLTKEELLKRYKDGNKIKADRRDWKLENNIVFKKEYWEKCSKWQKENPKKVKLSAIKWNKKNPNYYSKHRRNLDKKCLKCNDVIDNRSTLCKNCYTSSHKNENGKHNNNN